MIKKLKRIEVEEVLKSKGFMLFTPREFQEIFGVQQSTASVQKVTKKALAIFWL